MTKSPWAATQAHAGKWLAHTGSQRGTECPGNPQQCLKTGRAPNWETPAQSLQICAYSPLSTLQKESKATRQAFKLVPFTRRAQRILSHSQRHHSSPIPADLEQATPSLHFIKIATGLILPAQTSGLALDPPSSQGRAVVVASSRGCYRVTLPSSCE